MPKPRATRRVGRRPPHPALMEQALHEARKAEGRTRPNPMVGCVVALDERVVAVGHHARAGGPHAEVIALDAAGALARGADLYVTLEPCNHFGRTPPCTEAVIAAGVRRVIVGTRDENPIVNGKGIGRLRAAGVEVVLGLLREQCRELNRAFEHFIRTGRPYVVLKLAQSLDGRVATRTGASKWITGEGARRKGHELRNTCDAVLVGVGTVLLDDPQLTCRIRGGRDPVRVVVDTHARTPLRSHVVALAERSRAPTFVAVGPEAPARRVRELERASVVVLRCRARGGKVDLRDLLDKLGERELLSVLVEGGPTVSGAFLDAKLASEVHAFIAPLLLGGDGAKGSVGGRGAGEIAQGLRVQHLKVAMVGPDVHLWGFLGMPKF